MRPFVVERSGDAEFFRALLRQRRKLSVWGEISEETQAKEKSAGIGGLLVHGGDSDPRNGALDFEAGIARNISCASPFMISSG